MILVFLLLLCLASPIGAENNRLLPLNLSGAPNIDSDELSESVNLYIDSATDWHLDISAQSLRTFVDGHEVVVPAERIRVREGSGSWLELQEYNQRLLSGTGPKSLNLEYQFKPSWEDLSSLGTYEAQILYTLSSGNLYTSLCYPKTLKPGETAKIVFAKDKLHEAIIRILRNSDVVYENKVFNANEVLIKTETSDGSIFQSGEYFYEVVSNGVIVTKGCFEIKDQLNIGTLKGNIRSIDNAVNPFIEIYNHKSQLVLRKESAEAFSYEIALEEGTYELIAGTLTGRPYEFNEKVKVPAGQLVTRDIYLQDQAKLQVIATVAPESLEIGSSGAFTIELLNLSKEKIKDININIVLPEEIVWKNTGTGVWHCYIERLESKETQKKSNDFVVMPSAKTANYRFEVKVSAVTELGVPIDLAQICTLEVKPGMLSEPGILIGESPKGFYFANGTYIAPDEGFFSLQLTPGSYGLLLGAKPYVLNVSEYSQRVKLPKSSGKKQGLLEFQAQISPSSSFGVKGFYAAEKLKLAFLYPNVVSAEAHSFTPYPSWGMKSTILDRTPWQFSYINGDWSMGAGTVYSTAPINRSFATTALVGGAVNLAPENGVQLKLTGGFQLESKRYEEFLADGTTGPFLLETQPKDGSVMLRVEARNRYNQVIKTYNWDFYVDKQALKLKRPLVKADQLGLRNYLVVSYVASTPQASDKFFAGGHLGYKDQHNSLYLYRHLEDEGMMGSLSYNNWSIEGNLGRLSQDAVFQMKADTTKHELKLTNNKDTNLSYQLDFNGKWDSSLYLRINKGEQINRGEFAFDFENQVLQFTMKQKINLGKSASRQTNSEYYFYSASLKWPKNLRWGVSREGYNSKILDTFSTRMAYQLLGFSGYVEGLWRKPSQGKPKIAVSLAHDHIPLTLSAEWEHIQPEFSLLEACFDTKSVWTKISLCNEKASLKKTLGITILPKEGLAFVAVNRDDVKTQFHLPLSKTEFKLSLTGNLDSKIMSTALGIDVALSKRSQVGVTGIYNIGPKNNFRLQGFYRFKTDNFQLETRLADKNTGIYLTYLIPLGTDSENISGENLQTGINL